MAEKIPPQNLEAEISVLGAMMLEKEAIPKVVEFLMGDDFYKNAHKEIFKSMISLFDRGEPVDLVTLANELKKGGDLERIGGATYLTSLLDSVPTAANVEYYAKIVKDKSLLRAVIDVSSQIVQMGFADGDAKQTIDKAQSMLFNVATEKGSRGFVPMSKLVKDSFEYIESLSNKKVYVTGVATGFVEFDKMTNGLQPSDLIIIAGRPGMGKSAFCLNLAAHVSIEQKLPVAVFSLEMSSDQVVQRMLFSEARVAGKKLKDGYGSSEDWPKLTKAAGRLSEASIYIDDSPGLNVLDVRSRARRLQAEYGIKLLIIDYLQLMTSYEKMESRQQEVATISRSLKGLAKELRIPVIAVSQLNRAPEARKEGAKPRLADLRESGAIEQDADVVAFVYREEYYDRDKEDLKGKALLILEKQRNGPTGEVDLIWISDYTKFENPATRV